MEEPLYRVYAPAPEQLQKVNLNHRGTKTPRVVMMISGEMTEKEYREIFGPDRNMQSDICNETCGRDNYAIRVFLSDVLPCEGGLRSHQAKLINHALWAEGAGPLDEEEMTRRSRDYRDITLQAADALLQTAEWGLKHDEFNPAEEWERMKAEGITLKHLLRCDRPAQPAP